MNSTMITRYANKLLLPVLILLVSILFNTEKIDESVWKFLVHVLLQSLFLYGVLGLASRWPPARIAIAFLISLFLFIAMSYGAPLSVTIVMSAANTSPGEAWAFLRFNLIEATVCILIFMGLSFLRVISDWRVASVLGITGMAYLIAPALLSLEELLASHHYKAHQESGLARGHPEWFTKIEYLVTKDMARRLPLLASVRGLTDTISFMSQDTELDSSWSGVRLTSPAEDILVIGIGESLRAGNMAIYGYERDTTPVLSGLKKSQGIDIFGHAYAAGANTWSAIPAALSLSGHGGRADLSKSIVNLARDAGYKVYWISNQPRYSQWDFSVSAMAEQANETRFFSESIDDVGKDGILVSELQEILENKGNENILVFLHFYGSHMAFSDRYPEKFETFSGGEEQVDQYDNSIRYTDYLQGKVIDMMREHGGKYLFFADHGLIAPGRDMSLKHDVREVPDMDSLWVPMIAYPKGGLEIPPQGVISLYYFECIFSKWSGITADGLEKHCDRAMNMDEVLFLDSRLILHRESIDEPS